VYGFGLVTIQPGLEQIVCSINAKMWLKSPSNFMLLDILVLGLSALDPQHKFNIGAQTSS